MKKKTVKQLLKESGFVRVPCMGKDFYCRKKLIKKGDKK